MVLSEREPPQRMHAPEVARLGGMEKQTLLNRGNPLAQKLYAISVKPDGLERYWWRSAVYRVLVEQEAEDRKSKAFEELGGHVYRGVTPTQARRFAHWQAEQRDKEIWR